MVFFILLFASYAKINLFLNVLGLRPDGYHDLETVFITIALHDDIIFEYVDEFSFLCDLPGLMENNLILRAVKLFEKRFGSFSNKLNIVLKKQIPIGAGLGGGSSNAAMTLVALNNLYRKNVSKELLMDIALELGADVPFFINGGLAKGLGIGEKLDYYTCDEEIPLLLIYPDIFVSTKEAYGLLDLADLHLANSLEKRRSDKLIDCLLKGDLVGSCGYLYNSFEVSQFQKRPVLRAIKKRLMDLGALGALLSGSGSSVFGIFDSFENARFAYRKMALDYRQVFLTKTVAGYAGLNDYV